MASMCRLRRSSESFVDAGSCRADSRADPSPGPRWAARSLTTRPPERNRVWQTAFSEFETTGRGIWRICAVIDNATKYCLAAKITPTGRGWDALAYLDAAVVDAERLLGLDDLRDDRGELARVDETTGEVIDLFPAPIAVVSDNGSCFRARPPICVRWR